MDKYIVVAYVPVLGFQLPKSDLGVSFIHYSLSIVSTLIKVKWILAVYLFVIVTLQNWTDSTEILQKSGP